MTQTERRLYERIRRRAADLEPDAARRLLAAYDAIRNNLTPSELARAIDRGYVDQLINELLSDRTLDPAFAPFRTLIDRAVLDTASAAASLLPSPIKSQAFNILNPKIVEEAQRLDTRVIQGIKEELRATVKQHVIAGIEQGVNPVVTARTLRDVIGLAPNQEAAIRNFRKLLESGDAEALTRKLRDRRYDKVLMRGGPLSTEQIDNMTAAYRRRMEAFNASTHARSAALDAQRAGHRASWEEAIAQGSVDRDTIYKTWVTVKDDRVRPEHRAMDGQMVPFDSRYSNGDMIPGQHDYNCRCIERITIKRAAVAA